jgi:hypothetical protein
MLFRIGALGKRPMQYSAKNLPDGLTLEDNVICGKVEKEGDYTFTLECKNALGKDQITVTLEVKKDNYSAIKVYEQKGFLHKAVRKGYYNGIDGLLMERKYEDSSRK